MVPAESDMFGQLVTFGPVTDASVKFAGEPFARSITYPASEAPAPDGFGSFHCRLIWFFENATALIVDGAVRPCADACPAAPIKSRQHRRVSSIPERKTASFLFALINAKSVLGCRATEADCALSAED